MIISASRRTDIPAFYSEWFMNRLREKYVCVRNPMNTRQVSRISLDVKDVDFIVFWTKNPAQIMDKLNEIDSIGHQYYFHFTLNSFDGSIEPNVPKKTQLIDTFRRLADRIGPEKVIWRYDPVFFTDKSHFNYHTQWFGYLADKLHTYTHRCVISFLDLYQKTKRNLKEINYSTLTEAEIINLIKEFRTILKNKNISLETCASHLDLSEYSVKHSSCVDPGLIGKILRSEIEFAKDRNQREECGCMVSRDIGAYGTCMHLCRYCYANFSPKQVLSNCGMHSPDSPLILGSINEHDRITEIKPKSVKKTHTQHGWQEYFQY